MAAIGRQRFDLRRRNRLFRFYIAQPENCALSMWGGDSGSSPMRSELRLWSCCLRQDAPKSEMNQNEDSPSNDQTSPWLKEAHPRSLICAALRFSLISADLKGRCLPSST